MRRGRPPYPDLLTPREQEVLSLLREGMTNQQIADRLGISLYGARYHVSEILSKLGVSSREEAARWQPEPAMRRRGLFGVLLAPFGKLGGVSSYKLAGVSAIGASGVALGLLALGVLFAGMREEPELPDGLGKIAYVQDGDIWVLDLQDGTPVRLTDGGGHLAPRWSPSGDYILYSKYSEREPVEYWLARSNGADARQIQAIAEPVWAPGEDRLAYVKREGESEHRLVVEDASGHTVVLLDTIDHGWHSLSGYHWSPDGEWLALTATKLGNPFPVDYVAIWALRADGSDQREVMARQEATAGLVVAGWADSETVLYSLVPTFSASFAADGLQWETISIVADTTPTNPGTEIEPSRMVLQHDDYRDFAPDGRMVVVRGGYRYTTERKVLSLVEFHDGVTFTDLTPAGFAATSPAWSPAGSTIAYVMQPEDTTGDLTSVAHRRVWLIDSDGANQRRMNNIETRQERPQWSPDGRHVLYVGLGASVGEGSQAWLWLHKLSDGGERRLVHLDSGAEARNRAAGGYGHTDWGAFFDWWQP